MRQSLAHRAARWSASMIALVCLLGLASFHGVAAQSSACGALPDDVTFQPSNCVRPGDTTTLVTARFARVSMVSVLIVGQQGRVGDRDRGMRPDGDGILRLRIDTTSFFGVQLPEGSYRVVIRDLTGQASGLLADFAVSTGAPVAPPTPTPSPLATVAVAPTAPPAVIPTGTLAPTAPPGVAPTATLAPTASPGDPGAPTREYYRTIDALIGELDTALGAFVHQHQLLVDDPSLAEDAARLEEWMRNTGAILGWLEDVAERIGEVAPVPAGQEETDRLLKEISIETRALVDEYVRAFEEEDVTLLETAFGRIDRIYALIELVDARRPAA